MIDTFWWRPWRMPHVLREELSTRGSAWWNLARFSRRTLSNFGDELSPLIVEAVFGKRVRWVPPESADLLAVGSIIDFYLAVGGTGADVWGSGVREIGRLTEHPAGFGRILAVRGPRTGEALDSALDFVHGDPGILVGSVFDHCPPSNHSKSTILIPHYQAFASSVGLAVIKSAMSAGVRVVSPTSTPYRVLSEIRSADLVLSSSLHGLICAHSYGVPAAAVDFGGGVTEPDFKFIDYYDSIGCELERFSASQIYRAEYRRKMWDHGDSVLLQISSAIQQMSSNLIRCAS